MRTGRKSDPVFNGLNKQQDLWPLYI